MGGFGWFLRQISRNTFLVAFLAAVLAAGGAIADTTCPTVTEAKLPVDPARCAVLDPIVRRPGALPLNKYEDALHDYLTGYCHRNKAAGWRSDKRVRDTGPFTLVVQNNKWGGQEFGTHGPVVVWYSPEMIAWLEANRPASGPAPAQPKPIPNGAMIIKEMYTAPASSCAGIDLDKLKPTSGAAVMVRDDVTAFDGWFWGWFGWQGSGWAPDWPASPASSYPNMGFGQYCVNCHASARDNQTFSDLRNIEGMPGEPLVFLSQGMVAATHRASHHEEVAQAKVDVSQSTEPGLSPTIRAALGLIAFPLPPLVAVNALPPATYDNVWARPKGHPLDGFLTSDQCIGCHDAGSTGLQFDMTERRADGLLKNLSPYGMWRTTPMGMAGRDPIFLGQLASETDTFHPTLKAKVEDACLGCHGVVGQRAFQAMEGTTANVGADDKCPPMRRATLAVTPFPMGDDPIGALANYAGLARDGISCVACHRMVFGAEAERVKSDPQNACLKDRRDFLTPGLEKLAATFTGSFEMGQPGVLQGPFKEPHEMPMKHALGIKPVYAPAIKSAEICASCHTVHLPIMQGNDAIGYTYEQATYAEWAFSAYRTGTTPDGNLPYGAGKLAETCQGCHLPHKSDAGEAYVSKIASIQEHSNFPMADNTLPGKDIDLKPREEFARHTLVGLNLVFVTMAKQFPKVLGLPDIDPMLVSKGVAPFDATERDIRRQATKKTAKIEISPRLTGSALETTVSITNSTGHKFPSGVGFRRAFVEVVIRDKQGEILWASGRTNEAGVIVDGSGRPLASELWWKPDCSARISPEARLHQPHYQKIVRQDQAQIYEDLTAAPGAKQPATCTPGQPTGPLTTSFLSLCSKVKDNRLLPTGYLDLEERAGIARSLGAKRDLAEEAGPTAVGDDPDYVHGGGDRLLYSVPLADLRDTPASIDATLYYQSTPPYFLQDRACTSQSDDSKRLMSLVSNLRVDGTALENWKLKIVSSGRVAVP